MSSPEIPFDDACDADGDAKALLRPLLYKILGVFAVCAVLAVVGAILTPTGGLKFAVVMACAILNLVGIAWLVRREFRLARAEATSDPEASAEETAELEAGFATIAVLGRELLPILVVTFAVALFDLTVLMYAVIGVALIPDTSLRLAGFAAVMAIVVSMAVRAAKRRAEQKAADAADTRSRDEKARDTLALLEKAERERVFLSWGRAMYVFLVSVPLCAAAGYAFSHWMALPVAVGLAAAAWLLELSVTPLAKSATGRMKPLLAMLAGGEKRTWEI